MTMTQTSAIQVLINLHREGKITQDQLHAAVRVVIR